jgi:hypothetical protein
MSAGNATALLVCQAKGLLIGFTVKPSWNVATFPCLPRHVGLIHGVKTPTILPTQLIAIWAMTTVPGGANIFHCVTKVINDVHQLQMV